jgi:C_GCAxxG_C_C family probable redox protein
MSIRRFVMNNVERTVDLHSAGLNGSQAILTVFGEAYGLDAEMAANLGRPLGGGIGHLAKTCCAVTAAALILGLAKDHQDEREARKVSHSCVQDLFRRFAALHGTTECKELLGADMSTEEGLKKVLEEQLVRKVCPLFVRDAAIILEGLLSY